MKPESKLRRSGFYSKICYDGLEKCITIFFIQKLIRISLAHFFTLQRSMSTSAILKPLRWESWKTHSSVHSQVESYSSNVGTTINLNKHLIWMNMQNVFFRLSIQPSIRRKRLHWWPCSLAKKNYWSCYRKCQIAKMNWISLSSSKENLIHALTSRFTAMAHKTKWLLHLKSERVNWWR